MSAKDTSERMTPKGLGRMPFYYGWVVLAVAFITLGIGANVRVAFSLLYPPILSEFGWSRGETAAVFSMGFVASLLFTPFVGVLIDRFGVGIIVAIGAILCAIGLVLATEVSTVIELYITMGCMVVGGSVMLAYAVHSYFLPYWFVRKRGLAMGLAFGGVGVGAMVMFPWLQGIIGDDGWRRACYAMAILMVALVLPLNLLLQRRHPHDLGLEPDGANRAGRPVKAPPDDNVVDAAWVGQVWTLRTAMGTRPFWWLLLSFFFGMYAWYSILVHQTKFLTEVGVSEETAAFALGLVGLSGVASQLVLGTLSDRIGREWGWTIAYVGFVIAYGLLLLLYVWPSPVLVFVMVLVQGLIGYGASAVFPAIPAELFHGPKYGQIFGIYGAISGLGAAFGPWATGELYDLTGSYQTGFTVAMVASLVSIVTIWLAAPRKVRLVSGQATKRARLLAGQG